MSIAHPLRRLLGPAALLAAGGCAALGLEPLPPDPELLSARTAGTPRHCRAAEIPLRLPPPDRLVDTAALGAAVAELKKAGRAPAGHLLLSMGYTPDGTNVRRRVIEHSLSPWVADSLQKLVFAHRRTVPPEREEWGVRLRMDLGRETRYRVGRREVCPPRIRGSLVFQAPGSSLDRRAVGTAPLQTVWLRVHLDELGRVTEAQVERGVLRRGPHEALLLNYIRSLSFEPAREDGVPVATDLSLPIRIPW